MKIKLLFVLLLGISLAGAKCKVRTDLNAPETITLSIHWQFANPANGQIINMEDSVDIIYYKDYTIYRVAHPFLKAINPSTIYRNDSVISSQEVVVERVTYTHYLFKEKDTTGIIADSSWRNKGIFNVDSFLTQKGFLGASFYSPSDTLFAPLSPINAQVYRSTYIPKVKVDDTYPDTSYFFFNQQMKNVKFSFSPYLDSLERSKLFRIELVFNGLASENGNIPIPKRRFIFNINKKKNDEMEQLIDFIKKEE